MSSKLSYAQSKYKATTPTLELTGNRYLLLTNSPFNHSPTCIVTVKLITVGTTMALYTSSSGKILIHPDKSMTITQGAGSVGAQIGVKWDIIPSQLLAAGIDLQPGLVLSVSSQQTVEYSLDQTTRTTVPIIYMNGIDVTSFGTYAPFNGAFSGEPFMIGASGQPYQGYYGVEIQNGFHLYEFVLTNGTNREALDLQGYKAWYNGGRGIKYERLQKYVDKISTVQYFDPYNFKFGSMPVTVGLGQGAYAPVVIPPLSVQERDRGFKAAYNYRAGTKFVDFGLDLLTPSTQLSDYIYPGSQYLLRGYNENTRLKGAFKQFDGNIEYPQHLSKEIDLQFNEWGGETSDITTLSDIRNINTPSFNGRNQTPAGYDHVKMEFALPRVETLLIDNARKKQVELYPKDTLPYVVIGLARIGSNPFDQNFYDIFDPAKIKIESLDFNYTQSLSGPIRFSDNMTYMSGFRSGVSGDIPQPYPALNELELSYDPNLTGYPPNFANVQYLGLAGTSLTGTLIVDKGIIVNIAEKTAQSGNTIIDLTNHRGYMVRMMALGGKISQVKLPTTGQSTINDFKATLTSTPAFDWNPNSGVIFNAGGNVPAFEIEGSQNVVFPIGKIIASIYQTYRDCDISVSNTNATIDSWIDNQSGFAGPYAGLNVMKSLVFQGAQSHIDNGPASVNPFLPTDYTGGRADRVDKVRELILNYNWVLYGILGESLSVRTYTRLNSITPVSGHSNWVYIESASFSLIGFQIRRITNTGVIDGTVFTTKARGYSQAEVLGRANGEAQYNGGTDGGGYIYLVEIPGLDTSVTNVTGAVGVMETGV